MDGITEACIKGGIEACFTSVSCACALLGALDELLQGRCIQPEQVRAPPPGCRLRFGGFLSCVVLVGFSGKLNWFPPALPAHAVDRLSCCSDAGTT